MNLSKNRIAIDDEGSKDESSNTVGGSISAGAGGKGPTRKRGMSKDNTSSKSSKKD
jgi:hypothetical protein